MFYVAIDLATLSTPEFLSATDAQLGIWLKLNAYCATHENAGIISGCQSWPDNHWRRLIGCSRSDLQADSSLWFFRSGNLFLIGYNTKQEERQRQRRRAGQSKSPGKVHAARRNGRKGGRPKIIPITTHQT